MPHEHAHHGHAHHGHAHGHGLGDPAGALTRGFALAVALNLGFVILEAGAGLAIGSLALLADAGHNLSDVLGLGLAWGAAYLSTRRPSERRTYGLGRSSILAALANAVLLLLAVGAIGAEAVQRFIAPEPVAGGIIAWVALVGVGVNAGTALLFMRGRGRDLNRMGAYQHMIADAAVSLAVVIAGIAIGRTGWLWLDPAISLLVAAVILVGTWGLLRQSVDLALDAVPRGIDRRSVEAYLAALPDVCAVHDLHIWALSTTRTALTAHLVRRSHDGDEAVLARAAEELAARFGIDHATIQIEVEGHGCALAPNEVL